jgi:hypothetical protein
MVKEIWWMFFNVLIPLAPVPAVMLFEWVTIDGTPMKNALSFVKDGQLFFYCTTISSGALGDLIKASSDDRARGTITAVAGTDFWSAASLIWVMAFLAVIIASVICFGFCIKHNQSKSVREGQFALVGISLTIMTIILVCGLRQQAGLL